MSNPAGTTLGELMQRKETQFQQSIYDEGWNDCKKRILEIIENNRIYIANPIRTGYVTETDKLIKEIKNI